MNYPTNQTIPEVNQPQVNPQQVAQSAQAVGLNPADMHPMISSLKTIAAVAAQAMKQGDPRGYGIRDGVVAILNAVTQKGAAQANAPVPAAAPVATPAPMAQAPAAPRPVAPAPVAPVPATAQAPAAPRPMGPVAQPTRQPYGQSPNAKPFNAPIKKQPVFI